MWTRAFAASALVGALFLACGGRTDGIGPSGSSSGGSSGSSSGSSSGGSSGSSSGGSSSSGSSSGSTTHCVFVDLSSYDRSCNVASDCVYIQGGDVCDGSCVDCGSDLINVDGLSRYESSIASIIQAQCYCGAPSPIACVDHQCTMGDFVDAGPPEDAGVCVNVDLSTYDVSCKTDSDCIEITSGEICSGSCACGGSTINADGQARYDQQLSQVDLAPCACPAFGVARCVTGTCTLCQYGPNGTANCPDGG